jgi:hypothetical protein
MAAIEAGGWVLIIAAMFLGLTQMTALILQYLSGRRQEAITTELKMKTESNSEKLNAVTETNEKIHTLVNSNMGVQLEISAVFARRIAIMTKDPEDLRAADLAERYLAEHQAKQSIVDKQK